LPVGAQAILLNFSSSKEKEKREKRKETIPFFLMLVD